MKNVVKLDKDGVLVRCNMADSEKCAGCEHSVPHERHEENEQMCTKWGKCYNNEGEYFRVRCIKIKPNIKDETQESGE